MAELAQTARVVSASTPAQAAEQYDTRTLNFDFLALAALFLVVVGSHLQNPILLYDVTFGSAFRNATLQPVIALGLVVVTFLLGSGLTAWRAGGVKRIAFAVLAVYSVYILLAVLFDFNLLGAVLGID